MIRALLTGAILTIAALHAAPAAAQSATFHIFAKGQLVGNETTTVLVTDDGWKVTSTGTIAAPIALNTRTAEITYDKTWHPKTLLLDAILRGQASIIKTTFAGTKATSEIVQEERQFPKTDTVDPQTIVLPNLIFGSYEALAARISTAAPGATFRVYVAPQAEITVTLGAVSTERVSAPGRSFEARKHSLTFENPGGALAVDVWTDGARLMRIAMPSIGLEVVREDVATVAARTSSHYRGNDADVSIAVSAYGFKLAGTLSKPADAAPTAKLPAVVLIAGSGPLDRDETAYGIPIFAQLANGLADAGFAVIRYDKRGVGQSGGRSEFATLGDYAEDVVAVIKFLEKRKDIDPKRIALLGHSEGAAVALLAARRAGQVDAIALVAGIGTTGAQLNLEQQQYALKTSKIPEAEHAAKIELQKKVQAAVLTGKGWDDVPAEIRKQAESPWFSSFLAFDPAPLVAKLDQPIFVIQGALDTQVPPHHAEKLGVLANARKKASKTEIVVLPGINHLLVPAKTGDVSEYGSLPDRTVSQDVAAKIAAWLKALPPK
ncbi:MAG: alpha/beta fold hydrolase [Vicinamibacteraceae bacterium]